jgi:hypothetical protein
MAIVSAYTLIRSVCLFHFTLAVLFIRNPKMIAEQNFVFIMGESMQLVGILYDEIAWKRCLTTGSLPHAISTKLPPL